MRDRTLSLRRHDRARRAVGPYEVAKRVLVEGKVITAAGVSAGMDMAVTIAGYEAGDDEAPALHRIIEYDPQPPYNSGSFEQADADTRQRASEILAGSVEVTPVG